MYKLYKTIIFTAGILTLTSCGSQNIQPKYTPITPSSGTTCKEISQGWFFSTLHFDHYYRKAGQPQQDLEAIRARRVNLFLKRCKD